MNVRVAMKLSLILSIGLANSLSAERANAALSLQGQTATVNFSKLRLAQPDGVGLAALKGIVIGGAVGGLVTGFGTGFTASGTEYAVGSGIGATVGTGYTLIDNYRYTNAYNASEGYNAHGAAARNNAEGLKGLANYYGSEALIERDANDATPLMYAAATNSKGAAKAILEEGPKTIKVVKETAESVSTQAGKINWVAGRWEPGQTTTTQTNVYKTEVTIDMVDAQGNTAALWAALTSNPQLLELLRQFGADLRITNKGALTIAILAERYPAIKAVLDQLVVAAPAA